MGLKYTPGPWEVGKSGSYTIVSEKWTGNIVCDLMDNAEANAALIAAAPDLMEVAGAIQSFLRHLTPEALGAAGAKRLAALDVVMEKAGGGKW